MNANNFKVLLCCYTMGIAGCNKIGNPNYMDGGGDRTSEKRQDVGAAVSVTQSSSTSDYHKSLEDSLIGIKRVADLAEQAAIVKQQAAEDAIKAAADAKAAAEATRKTANDRERARQESPLPGSDTVYHKSLEDSLIGIKRVADLAEQAAIVKQQAAEDAIKAAADAKAAAEATRKTANDRERARRGLGGGDASTLAETVPKTDDREKGARLELGPGGDVL
ncbi:hypothetical protein [Cardinium endosymbiont of Nabis limbatus]|uniref:hypothetical protein n=1 Tax=Cardinium endosymbiont of Nabis limbatus TaxID=3066217 RepID=UPI003AF3D7AC